MDRWRMTLAMVMLTLAALTAWRVPGPVAASPVAQRARYVEAALDLSAPCIPAAAAETCDSARLALWNGEASAWAARGVTDPAARFNETVVFRVRAGDPAAIGNIARVLGQPYVKVTRLNFSVGREVLEITNLGGAAQDLTGWTARSPALGEVVNLPAEVIAPGKSCFVLTGRPGGTAGFECRVFVGFEQAPPVLGPSGLWPDEGGTVVLFADPLGLMADETRYSAGIDDQPPPPNLQGVIRVVDSPPTSGPLAFTLSADRSSYPPDAPVQFRMVWRNTSEDPQTATFSSTQSFDVVVTDLAGATVWRWSEGRAFAQSFRTVTLQPGEEQTFTASWGGQANSGAPAGPGIYEATVTLTASNPLRSNAVRFRIESRPPGDTP